MLQNMAVANQKHTPEVDTYLNFAALSRQQHCQEILSAIDNFSIGSKVQPWAYSY